MDRFDDNHDPFEGASVVSIPASEVARRETEMIKPRRETEMTMAKEQNDQEEDEMIKPKAKEELKP